MLIHGIKCEMCDKTHVASETATLSELPEGWYTLNYREAETAYEQHFCSKACLEAWSKTAIYNDAYILNMVHNETAQRIFHAWRGQGQSQQDALLLTLREMIALWERDK